MSHQSSLDAESLRLVLDSLEDFSKASLSDEKLLDFDEKDIFGSLVYKTTVDDGPVFYEGQRCKSSKPSGQLAGFSMREFCLY